MILSIGDTDKLVEYVDNQLQHMFCEKNSVSPWIDAALKKAEYCYSHTKNPYYYTNRDTNGGGVLSFHISTRFRIQYFSIISHAQFTLRKVRRNYVTVSITSIEC